MMITRYRARYRSIERRRLSSLGLAALLITLSCAQEPYSIDAAAQPSDVMAQAPVRERPSLAGFVPATGSRVDAKTGLPTRILHRASGIVLVLIQAGEFQMGSPEQDAQRGRRERQHRRLIRKPFYLGESEVTLGQFRKFVEATRYQTDAERGVEEGGHGKGAFAQTPEGDRDWSARASWQNPFPNLRDYRQRADHPVVQVSWNDAQAFCTHFGFQLPSEAQWEYAYRAGSCERFPWGDDEAGGEGYGNVVDLAYKKRFASQNLWFPFDDGAALIASAGRYRPNAWMLYDMTGNVQEWCQDAALKEYPGDGADESATQAESRSGRVLRGSSWLGAPEASRSAARFGFAQQGRRDFIGFRVAKALSQ